MVAAALVGRNRCLDRHSRLGSFVIRCGSWLVEPFLASSYSSYIHTLDLTHVSTFSFFTGFLFATLMPL